MFKFADLRKFSNFFEGKHIHNLEKEKKVAFKDKTFIRPFD